MQNIIFRKLGIRNGLRHKREKETLTVLLHYALSKPRPRSLPSCDPLAVTQYRVRLIGCLESRNLIRLKPQVQRCHRIL